MKIRYIHFVCRTVLILLFLQFKPVTSAQDKAVLLDARFKTPPQEALPRTWWHWTNSNVSRDGITKDLEWMKRAGIGGMQLADVAAGQGQEVEKKTVFMSPEWLDAVHHAASEAQRLGLEMTIFSSAGWSLTGGPWVTPEQAMKKLVWSETDVKGPVNFNAKLPAPPSVEGPVRNLTRNPGVSSSSPGFYRDCAVLAFPVPAGGKDQDSQAPSVTTGTGAIEADALLDDDLNTSVAIRPAKGMKSSWILYTFRQPFTARSVTIAGRTGIPVGEISYSNDGIGFRTLAVLPGAQLYRAGKVETISFPPVTAKYFRFEFTGAPMKPADVMAENATLPDSVYTFSEVKLHSGARINRWEDKAGFYHLFNYEPVESIHISSSDAIDPEKVIDLTQLMQSDGSVSWKVPEGDWKIMRFGYSLTGSRNRPAVPAGAGYEVDKLSSQHTTAYIKAYTEPFIRALGPLYGKSLQAVLLDSWEAGMQNWTDNMLTEFRKRRGYDLIPWLPCLSGYVVGNSEISDRVLWDFRRTLADMFAENHYKVITEFLNKQGIKTYGEASGVSLEIPEDALLCKKYVDFPMGEFWYRALHPELMYYQDIRGAASAAHVYGKTIVAAEAFTGGGFESPYTLKKIGDYWFTQGVNRLVFHTSAHQPLDTKPGNTMVGTHINRNITWAEQASPFMTYLARTSYMLQQGNFVADLAYLLDEGAPSTMPIWGAGLNPAPPDGYDYDYVNADIVVNLMSVSEDGSIVLPGGMSYKALVLPNTIRMTLPVLKKIRELVNAGATVVGPEPARTPGYSGFPASEDTLSDLAMEVWGDLDGISRTRRLFGKGLIVWGTPVTKILELKGLVPDVEYGRPLDVKIDWIHRRAGDADFYFIVNSTDRPVDTEIRFRVTGREAEIWDPATGEIELADYYYSGNTTTVPVHLSERQSAFIVFRKKSDLASRLTAQENAVQVASLDGPWVVAFSKGMGAPEGITVDSLKSWTTSNDEGIKYYSGTAVYSMDFDLRKKSVPQGTRLTLDLGKVCDIAEVIVNGIPAGVLWKAPFTSDISAMLRSGRNRIEIKVTNEWTNRLSGDMKAGPGKKVLNSPVFVMPSRLNESGLIGPVRILMNQNN